MIPLPRSLRRSLRRFGSETRGSASVELVIVLPLLLWALAATAVFFDGFKARYKSEMAAQTVADIMSRETQLFTPGYVDGLNTVYNFLADSRYPTRLRVSSLIWDSAAGRPRLQWSYGTNGLTALPANTFELFQNNDLATLQALFGSDTSFSFAGSAAQMPVTDLASRIPPILPGESVLLVESFALWTPFSDVGMGQMRLSPVVAVRPRFAPWINFEGIDPVFPETDYEIIWTGGGTNPLPPDPVVPDPPPPASPARSYSFDDGVTTGWSSTQTTAGGPTGSFLGLFGNETYANPVTLAVDLLTSGTNATIAFDLIIADSWDGYSTQHALPRGDNFTLMIDGQPISMDVFTGGASAIPYRNTRTSAVYLGQATYRLTMVLQGAPSGTNFIGSSWNDHIWRATLSIENAPRTFHLGFSAGTNSGVDDEGFGIDNLTIAASGNGTAAPFTPNPATLLTADPHTRFPRYSGCPDQRIAAPWLTMRADDLPTGITFTREAGGATNLGTCAQTGGLGRMNASPHLILNYDSQNLGRTLQFTMNDGNNGRTCDTTLLIRDPNGQWTFNDDLHGWNAGIRIASAVSGQYSVFIGTYGSAMCNAALTINRH